MKGWNGKDLPCDKCGGLCCRYAPIEMKAWEKVKHLVNLDECEHENLWKGTSKEAMVVWKKHTDGECFFLQDGRCSIYTYRPKACRAVGVKIPCVYIDPQAVRKMMFRS